MREVEIFPLRVVLALVSEVCMVLAGTAMGWLLSLLVDSLHARLDRVRKAE